MERTCNIFYTQYCSINFVYERMMHETIEIWWDIENAVWHLSKAKTIHKQVYYAAKDLGRIVGKGIWCITGLEK